MKWLNRFNPALWLGALCLGAGLSLGGEPPKPAAPEPPKVVPATDEEKKAELAKETPEQKALRAELEALAKAGHKIYFQANCDGTTNRIYVAKPDGSDVKCLTPDGDGSYPHASPDGKKFAFVSGRVPLKNPLPDELKSVPVDPNFPLNHKEQQWNRFYGKNPVVWMANADGSEPKPVAVGSCPHWSPDGKLLTYAIVCPPYPNHAAILDVEKKTELCLSHPGLRNCGFPCFTPDSKSVLGSNGSDFLVKLNADRTAIENVASMGGEGCNLEISSDAKWLAKVVDTDKDMGGWLVFSPIDLTAPAPKTKWQPFPLQHAKGSVNYYPDFSPDAKYIVYSHADQQPGIKSYHLTAREELYVTRFPKCDVTVRITWNGAANQHPHWWGPPAAK